MVNSREKKIARDGVTAELDAINQYEQMAAQTNNPKTRKVLLDIAKEEKTHMGEFQALLVNQDKEQKAELVSGKNEVRKITKSKARSKSRKVPGRKAPAKRVVKRKIKPRSKKRSTKSRKR